MEEGSGIQVFDRAAGLLAVLEANPEPYTLSALAKETGLSASTVHRILGALAAIGFVKLKALASSPGAYEIVYVIGEEALWGNGYGEAAIRTALSTAFFDWRARQVLARVYAGNTRSIRAVRACGFSCEHRDERLFRYRITMSDYLEHVQA